MVQQQQNSRQKVIEQNLISKIAKIVVTACSCFSSNALKKAFECFEIVSNCEEIGIEKANNKWSAILCLRTFNH
jgi:hypothetical protein